ncbi:MAG: hypothetical protein DA408_18905, partial [Bacteroidetes bacterium]
LGLTFILLLAACSKDSIDLVQEETAVNVPAQLATPLLFVKKDFRTNFICYNSFLEDPRQRRPPHPLNWQYYKRVAKDQTTDWVALAAEMKASFERERETHTMAELCDPIQGLSLRLMHWYIIPNGKLESKNDLPWLDYYTRLLFEYKAVDIDVMADALQALQPYISEADYQQYRSYLYEVCLRNENYVKTHFQEFYDAYKNAPTKGESDQYLGEGYGLRNRLAEANYTRELMGFGPPHQD